MIIEIDALCHKGLIRDNNEDALAINGLLLRDDVASLTVDISDEGSFTLLVADGMGGHENGEEASQYALESLQQRFSEHIIGRDSFEDDIRLATRDVALRLNQTAAERGQQLPMGCTLTGLIWHYSHTWLINAGDSRTYRLRNAMLRQLSTDQTERGLTGNPEASKLLLNCLGGGKDGALDITDMTGKVLSDDLFLICSDGLCDMVTDDQLEQALVDGATAADLYRMACEGGGVDNVSIILARCQSDGY